MQDGIFRAWHRELKGSHDIHISIDYISYKIFSEQEEGTYTIRRKTADELFNQSKQSTTYEL